MRLDSVDSFETFAHALAELRSGAGLPSFEEIARRIGGARSDGNGVCFCGSQRRKRFDSSTSESV